MVKLPGGHNEKKDVWCEHCVYSVTCFETRCVIQSILTSCGVCLQHCNCIIISTCYCASKSPLRIIMYEE